MSIDARQNMIIIVGLLTYALAMIWATSYINYLLPGAWFKASLMATCWILLAGVDFLIGLLFWPKGNKK